MEFQLTIPVPIDQPCVNEVIGRMANRSFPFIKGKRPISQHLDELLKLPDLIWTNPVLFEVNNARLAHIQDCKGTPLENFLRDLSTNEKPGFRALDQSDATISAKYSASAKFESTQCTATVPLQSHCVTEDPLEPNLPQ